MFDVSNPVAQEQANMQDNFKQTIEAIKLLAEDPTIKYKTAIKQLAETEANRNPAEIDLSFLPTVFKKYSELNIAVETALEHLEPDIIALVGIDSSIKELANEIYLLFGSVDTDDINEYLNNLENSIQNFLNCKEVLLLNYKAVVSLFTSLGAEPSLEQDKLKYNLFSSLKNEIIDLFKSGSYVRNIVGEKFF